MLEKTLKKDKKSLHFLFYKGNGTAACDNAGLGSWIFLPREGKLFSSGGKLNGIGIAGVRSREKRVSIPA